MSGQRRRRGGPAAVLLAALTLLAGPAAATAAPTPAPVAPPALVVTGVQTTQGTLEFFLAGRDLPVDGGLAGSPISVTADGVTLPSTVRAAAGSGSSGPTRGVVLVVDASGSMAGARIAGARAAAVDYARAAPAGVWLGLVTVADRPTVVLTPTADRGAFIAAAGRIRAAGKTALYDGIAAGEALLDPERQPVAAAFVERRLVVLSDGADTASAGTAEGLRSRLSQSPVTIDAVAFGAGADRAELTGLTEVTGGRVLPARDAAALRSVFRAMAAGLSPPVTVRATVPPELAGRSTAVRVSVRVGGAVTVAEAPVTFAADPNAGAAPTPFLSTAPGGATLVGTVGALALALFLGALLVVHPLLRRSGIRRRLRELDRFTAGSGRAATGHPASGESPMLRAALAMSERAVRTPDRRERIELALDRAGSPLRVAEWQLIRAGAALAGAFVGMLILPWWFGLPAGALAGWLATGLYLKLRTGRRTARFADQLPDALQLVVGSLRSGFSLPQSLDALVREGAEPVAGELGRALAETRLGGDLEDALDRVGQRNSSQDMAWLVMAIRIQRDVGGNLSEVLETAVATMRERARLARHVRGLSAEGRLSALILFAMPIVLGLGMFAFRREYLRPLYTEPMGMLMLATCVVMMAVGGLWMRKLVQVEV